MRKRLQVLGLLVVAACTSSSSSPSGGIDAGVPLANTIDDGGTSSDAGPTGCPPCVVGTSSVGNCCVR
jgi:hypothetical protein